MLYVNTEAAGNIDFTISDDATGVKQQRDYERISSRVNKRIERRLKAL